MRREEEEKEKEEGGRKRKRRGWREEEEEEEEEEEGILKPDVVFFGEGLPEVFHKNLEADKREVRREREGDAGMRGGQCPLCISFELGVIGGVITPPPLSTP